MAELTNPHDRFFKEMLSHQEAARDFVHHYLPAEVVGLLDLASLEMVKDSFVDADLQEHFSDLLYKVVLQDGRPAYVYVLFEHKSFPDPLVAFQLLRYMVRVWEYALRQRASLVPIFPAVVYHGRAAWRVAREFHRLFDTPPALAAYLPDYRYWLCDLSQYSDEEIKGSVLLRVALLALKHIFSHELEARLPGILALLRELPERATGLEYLETLLRYLSSGTDQVTEAGLRQAVEAVFAEEGSQQVPTLAEKWLEQGLQQGLQQGLEQGLQQGLEQGLQQGMYQGLLDGIELGLELKFGAEGLRLLPEIRKITDVDLLRTVHEAIKVVNNPDELRRLYHPE